MVDPELKLIRVYQFLQGLEFQQRLAGMYAGNAILQRLFLSLKGCMFSIFSAEWGEMVRNKI